MAYGFTKQKVAKERKALPIRLIVIGLAAAAGLALGGAVNDMHSFFGLFAAGAVAVGAGVFAYVITRA